jgi:hypothetical protein
MEQNNSGKKLMNVRNYLGAQNKFKISLNEEFGGSFRGENYETGASDLRINTLKTNQSIMI